MVINRTVKLKKKSHTRCLELYISTDRSRNKKLLSLRHLMQIQTHHHKQALQIAKATTI